MKFKSPLTKETFASLKVRNYRLYFIGQAISLSGTWMQTIAQSWLVLKLTGSGTALGVVTAVQFLPILFFGPFGGVVTDRFSKKKLLYFTQAASGIISLVLGFLVASSLVRLWMVYVLAAALGLVKTIDNPTRQTFIVELVGKKNFANAVTLNSTEFNLARVVGPTIAGVLIATLGIAACFFIDGVSYAAVLAGIFMMRDKELHITEQVKKAKGQLREGFRYVWRTPVLRDTLIMMAIIGTLTFEFQVILPLLAQFTFHGDAGTYAALSAAVGLGSVIGALFGSTKSRADPRRLIKTAFFFGLVIIICALMPTLPTAFLALVVVGIFSINFTILGNVTLQMESDPQMRGRVMALWSVAFIGTTPIGGPIIGWIGQEIGPRVGLFVGGAAAIVAAAFGMWSLGEKKVILRMLPKALLVSSKSEAGADRRIP